MLKIKELEILNEQADYLNQEALDVLLQLGYSKTEAEGMIQKAIQRDDTIKSTEELLNTIYTQKKQN